MTTKKKKYNFFNGMTELNDMCICTCCFLHFINCAIENKFQYSLAADM